MRRLAVLAVALLCIPIPALGQVCDDAKDLLKQNVKVKIETESEALAFLDILDESSWSQASKDGSLGVTFPIKGIPIEGKATYGQFDEARRSALALHKYDRNYLRSLSTMEKGLSPEQLAAYIEVVAICTGQRMLKVVSLPSATDSVAQVKIKWVDASMRESVAVRTSVIGGSVAGVPAGMLLPVATSFAPNQERTVTISRAGRTTITGVVELTGKIPEYVVKSSVPFQIPVGTPSPRACNAGAGAWFVSPSQGRSAQSLKAGSNLRFEVAVLDACFSEITDIELSYACKVSPTQWDHPGGTNGPTWISIGKAAPTLVGFNAFVAFAARVPSGGPGKECQMQSMVNYKTSKTSNYMSFRLN